MLFLVENGRHLSVEERDPRDAFIQVCLTGFEKVQSDLRKDEHYFT